ncbi:MAG TPA: response regulator [Spirochaetia bacterium]|nr:response regulator [Spirochaetia bacterium]
MKLRLLFIEDSPEDVELATELLSAEGIECETTVVSTDSELRTAVAAAGYDLILCDYSLPVFSGSQALDRAKELVPDIPFIFVSGAIGEDVAIDCLKRGATDYVLKDRLGRLVPVIRRAIAEAGELRKRRAAEQLLKESNEQLFQAQKLEAIGRLTGGIAHDFNNILTAVRGYSELILMSVQESDPIREFVTEIITASDRAAALLHQLLAFNRNQILEPRLLNLNEQLRSLEKLLGRVIGENITMRSVLDPKIWPVIVDPIQFDQVVMNLVINSRDAMPTGGTLLLETENASLDESYSEQHPGVQPGDYVMVAVSDTGAGMSKETISHIFEPFFTTKEVGKGTGLGLSTVFGIVRQSRGEVWVYSEVGRGTTFKLFFPRAAQPLAANELALPVPPGGSETILVVEDNSAVRGFVAKVLGQAGYAVQVAADGSEALDICSRIEGPVHLVVTDIIMPGMDGIAVAAGVRLQYPRASALFTSGYTRNAIGEHGIDVEKLELIQKPLGVAQLLRRVRSLLDATAQAE